MTFFEIIGNLFIGPLKLLFEFIFQMANRFGNPGISIIALSVSMNFLVLPLYQKANLIQKKQREKEKEMEHWVKHIRKTFYGDERFMLLQTYYRQNNYSPFSALKGLLPLLLQIPFFIAAYQF